MRTRGWHRVGGVRRAGGFTLPELMVAMAIFLLLVAAVLSTTIYGMRSQAIIEPRLAAEEAARRVATRFEDQVQRAVLIRLGTGDETAVTAVGYGAERRGPAMELQLGTNVTTLDRVVYYFSSGQLWCGTNGASPAVVASGLNAASEFVSVDENSAPCTTDPERVTVEIRLIFDQVQMGTNALAVGGGAHFAEYDTILRVTQRGG